MSYHPDPEEEKPSAAAEGRLCVVENWQEKDLKKLFLSTIVCRIDFSLSFSPWGIDSRNSDERTRSAFWSDGEIITEGF